MIARRAYNLYAAASGIRRVRQALQSRFNDALSRAVSTGALVAEDEWGSNQEQDLIVRIPGTAATWVRTRGDRDLDEIPPREIATLMDAILAKSPLDKDALLRTVLGSYGQNRLTTKAHNILEFARKTYLQRDGG